MGGVEYYANEGVDLRLPRTFIQKSSVGVVVGVYYASSLGVRDLIRAKSLVMLTFLFHITMAYERVETRIDMVFPLTTPL